VSLTLLLEMLRYRRRTYIGEGFSVRIRSMVREGVSVSYKRQDMTLDIKGDRTGKNWEQLQLSIPEEIGRTKAIQIALDLETAFIEMNYQYAITQGLETLRKSKKVKS
jgi:hypothetical protein